MKKNIVILLADGFEEIEALAPADVLRRLNFQVTLAVVGGQESAAGAHGIRVAGDARLADVPFDETDALILPGGMPGSRNLQQSERVLELVRRMHRSGRIVAAICAAPIVLEAAGVLENTRYTMYPGFESVMSGRPTGSLVEHDGNIITGKGPGAAFAFASEIASALGIDAGELYRNGMFIQGYGS